MDTIELDGEMWYTIRGAAEIAGVQPITVYKAVDRSGLRSRKVLGVIVVPEKDVREFWCGVR